MTAAHVIPEGRASSLGARLWSALSDNAPLGVLAQQPPMTQAYYERAAVRFVASLTYAESEGVREALVSSTLLETLKGALCFGCGVRFGNNDADALRHSRGCVTCGPARKTIALAEAAATPKA